MNLKGIFISSFLLLLTSQSAQAACQTYQGYAKGTWRKKIEYVFVSARLCGQTDLTGKMYWHWAKGIVGSSISGGKQGSELDLFEENKSGNGYLILKQNTQQFKGIYHYYKNDFPDFQINLMPVISGFSYQEALDSFSKKGIQDPILILSALRAQEYFDSPHFLLSVKQPAATQLLINLRHEKLHDDSIAGIMERFQLSKKKGFWNVKQLNDLYSCGRGGRIGAYQTRTCI